MEKGGRQGVGTVARTGGNPLTRRTFFRRVFETLVAAFALTAETTSIAKSKRRPRIIAGAIRWDAWYRRADFSIAAQHNLSTAQHYQRAPFFCSTDTEFQVTCLGTAEEMDKEIIIASENGLQYWAFVWYGPQSSLRTAWNLYNDSAQKHRINWCGIVELSYLGSVPFSNNKWKAAASEWATYMSDANYQKVDVDQSNRPLLFLLWDARHIEHHFDNEISNVRICIAYLQSLLAAQGIAPAHIVVQLSPSDSHIIDEIGAHAIGAYIPAFRPEAGGPYLDLDTQTRSYWKQMSDTGVSTVPTAMVGWDIRPRNDAMPPENRKARLFYYVLPTPSELKEHIACAVDFIRNTPLCRSNALLIYSWDECDEGGGLIPTLADNAGKYLSAIKPLLF